MILHEENPEDWLCPSLPCICQTPLDNYCCIQKQTYLEKVNFEQIPLLPILSCSKSAKKSQKSWSFRNFDLRILNFCTTLHHKQTFSRYFLRTNKQLRTRKLAAIQVFPVFPHLSPSFSVINKIRTLQTHFTRRFYFIVFAMQNQTNSNYNL